MTLGTILNESFKPKDYNAMIAKLEKMGTYRTIAWDYMDKNFGIVSVNRRKDDLIEIIMDMSDERIEELIKVIL